MNPESPVRDAGDPARDALMLRLATSCLELNTRIARLGMALGASLETEFGLAAAVHGVSAPAFSLSGAAERRQEQLRSELRGLILLRDEMEKEYVDALGPFAARKLLLDVEARLARQGFAPGADGMGLERLLGPREAGEAA